MDQELGTQEAPVLRAPGRIQLEGNQRLLTKYEAAAGRREVLGMA
jgi:hypothetical protein